MVEQPGPRTLRVLTWNIKDHLGDPLAVHRVLRAADPDVVCLQEASRWPGSRFRLAHLARATGLYFTAGGRPSAGTAVLTGLRVEVLRARAEGLPVKGRLTRPRGWAGAVVRLPGTAAVQVLSIHLGLTATERADHVTRLLRVVGRVPAALPVVAGDLNEAPGAPSWQALGSRVRDPRPGSGPTYPAASPRRRIDAVLVDPVLEVTSYGWPPGVSEDDVRIASDHRPVVASVLLPPAPGA